MQAQDVIKKLRLTALEPEGGYFAQTYKAEKLVNTEDGDRSLCTAIYYLITSDNFSRFHILEGTEIYHFYAGAPAELVLISKDGKCEKVILGTDFGRGSVPQAVVPSQTWQAVRIADRKNDQWTLLGTTMSPGFEFEDFEVGDRSKLVQQFPDHQQIILELTRA